MICSALSIESFESVWGMIVPTITGRRGVGVMVGVDVGVLVRVGTGEGGIGVSVGVDVGPAGAFVPQAVSSSRLIATKKANRWKFAKREIKCCGLDFM